MSQTWNQAATVALLFTSEVICSLLCLSFLAYRLAVLSIPISKVIRRIKWVNATVTPRSVPSICVCGHCEASALWIPVHGRKETNWIRWRKSPPEGWVCWPELHGHFQGSRDWEGVGGHSLRMLPSLGWTTSYIQKKDSNVQFPRNFCLYLSYLSQSFPESFPGTVSLLWNPEKSLPCVLPVSIWGKKSLSCGTLVCHPSPLQCVGRSALCCTCL